jgi:hypothetical protein
MRSTTLTICLVTVTSGWAAAQEAGVGGVPFWSTARIDLGPLPLFPTTVELLSPSNGPRGSARGRAGNLAPDAGYVPTNPRAVPFIASKATGYRIRQGGLRAGAPPYGDRTYSIRGIPDALSGLTLLQTGMGHKAITDLRYAIVVSVAKPCYVFLAIDDRAIRRYGALGTPSWLEEYSPTGYAITTDEPLMADVGAVYRVFARKVSAGRVVLGPPCMDPDSNAMYFAFFGSPRDYGASQDGQGQRP